MPVDQKYAVTLKNEISQIPVVVQQLLAEVQKVGSLSQRERCRMCLALEEAITNSLVHGNLCLLVFVDVPVPGRKYPFGVEVVVNSRFENQFTEFGDVILQSCLSLH